MALLLSLLRPAVQESAGRLGGESQLGGATGDRALKPEQRGNQQHALAGTEIVGFEESQPAAQTEIVRPPLQHRHARWQAGCLEQIRHVLLEKLVLKIDRV